MAQPVPPGTLSNGQINLPLTSATTASTDNIHQNYKNQPNSHSGQQFNNQTSSTTPNSKMIGTSVPWNPNATAIPSYPNDETLNAEYRAFLSTYRSSGAPGPTPVHQTNPAQRSVSYGPEGKQNSGRIESPSKQLTTNTRNPTIQPTNLTGQVTLVNHIAAFSGNYSSVYVGSLNGQYVRIQIVYMKCLYLIISSGGTQSYQGCRPSRLCQTGE